MIGTVELSDEIVAALLERYERYQALVAARDTKGATELLIKVAGPHQAAQAAKFLAGLRCRQS